ncbi:MAG: thioredoxin family protein [Bacillota bacterium]|nr:thioredoxin family protein [Bacillota bacterium]
MLSLDQTNFTSVINRQDRPVIVKFYADWCKDCRAIRKPAAELAEQYADAFTFAEIDTMVAPEIRDAHLVRGIPTFIAFWRGAEIGRIPAPDSAQKEVKSREELEAFLQQLRWLPRV